MLGLVLAYSDVRKNLAWGAMQWPFATPLFPPAATGATWAYRGPKKGGPNEPEKAGHDQEQGPPVEPRMAPFGPEFKRKKQQNQMLYS